MTLKDYIQGDKHGKEANRLEREAMNDPFLQDALEGFDAVTGDHAKVIEKFEKRFAAPPSNKRRLYLIWSMAASILLLIGVGTFFLWDINDNRKEAIVMLQTDEAPSIPELPVQSEALSELQTLETAPPATTTLIEMETPTSYKDADNSITNASKKPASTEKTVQTIPESVNLVEDIINDLSSEDNDIASIDAELAVAEQESFFADRAKPSKTEYPTSRNSAVRIDKDETNSVAFGEKEFQTYCRQKATQNICDEKTATVKVSFYIDVTGQPTQIKFIRYTCEKAKEEITDLLSSSPAWTTTNRKVTMTLRW